MNLLIKIKAFFTPKDWQYFNYVKGPDFFESEYPYHKYRICNNTGVFQKLDIHCLGLNPPEHIHTWNTVDKKPVMCFNNGVWEVKEK